MKPQKAILIIIAIVTLLFLPLLIKPELLTHKDNDLGRNYIPIFNFYRQSIIKNHQVPLWRSEQMMGENFVANPISSLFYPLNLVFVIFPIHLGSIIYILLHFLIAAISTYFLARSYKLSSISSVAAALFYALSIKIVSHAAAGHMTMIAAFSYFPLVFLALNKLYQGKTQRVKWLIIAAASLAIMYFTYPTIFFYAAIFLVALAAYRYISAKRFNFKSLVFFVWPLIIIFPLTVLLSAIVLLPQLEFAPLSTRVDMKFTDVAIPIWNVKLLASSILFPYQQIKSLDHESLLYFGFIPTILATVGFYYLSKFKKLTIALCAAAALIFAAGASTPLFKIAYSLLPFLQYSRVTTRHWFIVALIVALLAAYALDKIGKKKVTIIAISIFLIEIVSLGNYLISRISSLNFKNLQLYDFIASDKDTFRVYCATYCFNPQLAQGKNIQLINGENPIQVKSFVNFLETAGNYTYGNFAVIFPPYQAFQTDKPPQPNGQLLGAANVKYVASTYELDDHNFTFIEKFENVNLYKNNLFKKRAYFENANEEINLTSISPNKIYLSFVPSDKDRALIYSENYDSSWEASTSNNYERVEKFQEVFRKITVPANSSSLSLRFKPKSFIFGAMITTGTIALLPLLTIKSKKRI